MRVVSRWKQMTPVELYEGFRRARRETFRFRNILARTSSVGRSFPIALSGTLTCRLFVTRLQRTRGFQMPLPERAALAARAM